MVVTVRIIVYFTVNSAAKVGRHMWMTDSCISLWCVVGGHLRWLCSLVVRASDLQLNGREFNPRPLHYQSFGTGMGDRLWVGLLFRCVTSHPGQLSLLLFVGPKISTGHSVVMCCDWGVKAGWLFPFVDKRVGGW